MNRRGFFGVFGAAASVVAAPAVVLAAAAAAPTPAVKITLRSEKGAPLTADELDDNFRRLAEYANASKLGRHPRWAR